MGRILRGDILWANLDPTRGHEQSGSRPILVLSKSVFNERSGTVIAVAVISQRPSAGFPLTLELGCVISRGDMLDSVVISGDNAHGGFVAVPAALPFLYGSTSCISLVRKSEINLKLQVSTI